MRGLPMFDSIFEIFWLIGFIVGSAIRAIYAKRPKKHEITVDRKIRLEPLLLFFSSLGLIVLPLIYLFTSWLGFADYHLSTWAGWIGASTFAFALLLLWKSHVDLGKNFSPMLQIKEQHQLITNGVFRYIRHPIYAAHLLWGVAQALLLQNWIAGLAMLVTSLPLYLVRVPHEESMMLEHFGEEYNAYMSQTGRIFPRLWR